MRVFRPSGNWRREATKAVMDGSSKEFGLARNEPGEIFECVAGNQGNGWGETRGRGSVDWKGLSSSVMMKSWESKINGRNCNRSRQN